MKKIAIAATIVKTAMTVLLAVACTRTEAIDEIPAGTEVTIRTADGTIVRGKIAKVETNLVTLNGERPNSTTEITRTSISEVKRVNPADRTTEADRRAPAPAAAADDRARAADDRARAADDRRAPAADDRRAPAADDRARAADNRDDRAPARRSSDAIVRTYTIPDNTTLDVTLNTALASNTSRVEQRVDGTLASPVQLDGVTVIPSGSSLRGHVTHVDGSDKIKGRAELAFRFTSLTVGAVTYDIATQPLAYVAEGTKKDDAVKIGVGAAAGAVIGAIAGGKKGAAIGTAVGAGAGTGVVLATDGKEIRLAEGRKLKVSLSNPLTIRTK